MKTLNVKKEVIKTKGLISKEGYYQQDTTWEGFGVNSQEEYEEKFVIKSNFHNAVHEDVISSYKTIEYLMAHAYFHYPMFDEAKKKLLHMVEMAVKLRNKELGNSLTFETRNGRTRKKTLNQLIDELVQFDYPEEFIGRLNWIRDKRNMASHPDRHSFGGGMYKNMFYPIINCLNELFLLPNKLVEYKSELEKYKDLENLKGVFKVPHKNKAVLGYDPEIRHCWLDNNTWIYSVYFQPVLTNTKESLENHITSPPILNILSNLIVSDKGIEAIDTKTGEKIEFEKTTKSENLERYNSHISDLKKLNSDGRIYYTISLGKSKHYEVEMAIYNTWDNY